MPSQLIVQPSDRQSQNRQPAARAMPVRAPSTPNPSPNEAPSAHAQPVTPAGSVTSNSSGPKTMLSFVNADLAGVVQALARFTGQNFLVDPRVKGQLTLISEQPVDADTAYAMLLGALRMQGFAVVNTNGVNRVVPEADAKLLGSAVMGNNSTEARRGELVTRVFQLRYENAASLMPILRPMISPNNTINEYAGNNTLVITDYADNLQRIAEVIARIDTPSSLSTDVVPIRHGLALDVAALASQMLGNRDSRGAGNQTVILADARSNSVLIRASSPDRLDLARKLVRRIDSSDTSEGNLNVVYLRNAQATQLAQVLRGVLSGGQQSPSSSPSSPMMPPSSPAPRSQSSSFGGFSPITEVIGTNPVGTGMSADGSSGSTTMLGNSNFEPYTFSAGGATVQADPTTNTLLISAPPPIYRNLRRVIDQLDQRRAQVLVETLIIEVNAEDAAAFGIQWMAGGDNLSRNSGTGFFGGANFGGTGINTAGATTIDSLGAGLSLGVVSGSVTVLGNQILNLGVLARAMQSNGDVNVLSTPNLMTLDNEEASIMVGRTVPFVTGQYTTSADGASNPFQTITREDVGLTLRIRPQISEGGTVKLSIYQEVSSIDTAASNARNGIITRKRALDTDVLIDDGQIIVLGGLIEDMTSDETNAVPFLGSLPGIGALFRYETRTRTKTNLMVFLRPHIVRDSRDGASVTLDRYNYMRSAQQNTTPRASVFESGQQRAPLPNIEQNPTTGLLDLRSVSPQPATSTPASSPREVPPSAPVISF